MRLPPCFETKDFVTLRYRICVMDVREELIEKVIAEGGFWSYEPESVRANISDEQLIEAVLERLDLEEIGQLFTLFSKRKIKQVWLNTMVPQGDYYYSLNRFYAWYYFDIRHPDRYLKSMLTRHLSKLTPCKE